MQQQQQQQPEFSPNLVSLSLSPSVRLLCDGSELFASRWTDNRTVYCMFLLYFVCAPNGRELDRSADTQKHTLVVHAERIE